MDFGLAKTVAAGNRPEDATVRVGITDPGTTMGTIAYMSPEQASRSPNLTAQSDQFSFGLILYELAAGKRPFQRASAWSLKGNGPTKLDLTWNAPKAAMGSQGSCLEYGLGLGRLLLERLQGTERRQS